MPRPAVAKALLAAIRGEGSTVPWTKKLKVETGHLQPFDEMVEEKAKKLADLTGHSLKVLRQREREKADLEEKLKKWHSKVKSDREARKKKLQEACR